jgi:hypothetical protein
MVIRTLVSPPTLIKLLVYFFLTYWSWYLVLLLILIDYFNVCTDAHSLRIAVQIKTTREPSLVFSGYALVSFFFVVFRKA